MERGVRNVHRLAAAAIILGLITASLQIFRLLHGRDAAADVSRQPGGWGGAAIVVVLGVVVHELLHAIGWMIAGNVPRRAIRFRPTWRKFGVAATLDIPLRARDSRIGLALPALILWPVSVAIGLAYGNGLFIAWAAFFLLECFADLTLLLADAPPPRA